MLRISQSIGQHVDPDNRPIFTRVVPILSKVILSVPLKTFIADYILRKRWALRLIKDIANGNLISLYMAAGAQELARAAGRGNLSQSRST